ncbi:MAG: hypothetical protein HY692_09035, partial [Cyanobacteria bacterium NC_groundwater_1444_Ag_S-0.65um_54_12]|nr:hypothetical protein [Cyanobacteria bacterium NC_groundwater_1444_Ag_S-0.65um_54_12]
FAAVQASIEQAFKRHLPGEEVSKVEFILDRLELKSDEQAGKFAFAIAGRQAPSGRGFISTLAQHLQIAGLWDATLGKISSFTAKIIHH